MNYRSGIPFRSIFTYLNLINMMNDETPSKVSYIVFFCTIIPVLLILIPIIFPLFFSSYFSMFTENLNPFEFGYLSSFFIICNIAIFGFGIAYYKKKIPSLIHDLIEKIRTFEISKKVAVISLVIIIGVYIGL